jgi:hypothetical protein
VPASLCHHSAMDAVKNLYEAFRAGEIKQDELSEMAFWHFHSAVDLNQNEVAFGAGSDRSQFALKFVYAKNGRRLSKIEAGPVLTPEDQNAFMALINRELDDQV